LYEAIGVLHVHTLHSDGTGTPAEISSTASDAGLSFVGINDHRTLFLRDHGLSGLQDGVFFLTGAELEDDRRQNHMLVYGIDRLPPTGDTLDQLKDVRRQGGIAIAAHPFERGGLVPGAGTYRWSHGAQGALSGVEIWNYMSAWKRKITPLSVPSRLKDPDRYTMHPDHSAMNLWFETGGCAVACPDAHALRPGLGRLSVTIFPYSMLFRRLRTHLLLECEPEWSDTPGTEKQILSALAGGRCFASNFIRGDASGFGASRTSDGIRLELPMSGEVSVYTAGVERHEGTMEAGEHYIERVTFPAMVSVERNGGTWIVCGLS